MLRVQCTYPQLLPFAHACHVALVILGPQLLHAPLSSDFVELHCIYVDPAAMASFDVV